MLNSQKACGNDVSLASLLDLVTASNPHWSALYLPEFVGYLQDVEPPASEHYVYRHYPGEGSSPMAWDIHSSFRHLIRCTHWYGRAGSLLLGPPSHARGSASSCICLVGFHSAHGDALEGSLTDLTVLIKSKPS